jgi:hypothetical protein
MRTAWLAAACRALVLALKGESPRPSRSLLTIANAAPVSSEVLPESFGARDDTQADSKTVAETARMFLREIFGMFCKVISTAVVENSQDDENRNDDGRSQYQVIANFPECGKTTVPDIENEIADAVDEIPWVNAKDRHQKTDDQ